MLATKHKTLTDATEQTILEVPTGYICYISYVFIANHGGSTNTIDLWWESEGTPQVYMFDGASINGKTREELGGQASTAIFVIHSGESVKAQAGGTGNMEVAITFDLRYQPINFSNFNSL